MASKDQLGVFTLPDDNSIPKLLSHKNISGKIISVQKGKNRNECFVLLENGRVVSYDLRGMK